MRVARGDSVAHGDEAVSCVHGLRACSGGQYFDGTTDTTRTVHFGTPTDYQRRCFTRVLQGHIALARVSDCPHEPA